MAGYLRLTLLLVALSLVGCASGPTHDQTLTEQGQAAMQAGNMDEAEGLFNQAIQENPNNLQALTSLGMLYQNSGRPDEARPLYQRVIDGEAMAEENDQDPEEAARLAQVARDSMAQMDREEAQRREEEEAQRAAAEAAAAQLAAMQAQPEPEPVVVAPAYRVQVGAYNVAANAERMRERLMTRHGNLIEGKEVSLVEMGRMTKVQIGPYDTGTAANQACRSLKRAGVGCFLIKP